tara:strand:- start:13399 stop:14367 length:969 start_codon:yes stop_codon:yes gene_type:complete
MIWGAVAGLASAGLGLIGSGKRKREAAAKEKAARNEMNKMKQAYMDTDISNPFADMENQFEGMENKFSGMQNQFAGLENTMEDLTVNKQQAEFEAQQFSGSQANIMDQMAGAAGGSGIAATAQALAGQGALQAQKSSASIGQQEASNQMAAAEQAGNLQQQEAQGAAAIDMASRQGEADVDMQIRQGAASVDTQKAQGEQLAQQRELDRNATLLGMAQQETAAYGEQAAQAESQKMDAIGGIISAIPSFLSDRRLKKNIKLIGNSPSGLRIYAFEYINKAFGDGIYQGVMSDEIPKSAIVKHRNGYDMVDYSKLDVKFKNIS